MVIMAALALQSGGVSEWPPISPPAAVRPSRG